MALQISYQNYMRRLRHVRDEMQKRGLRSLLVMSATNIQYLTGFWHVPTERPTILLLPLDGEPTFVTGKLEYRNAQDRVPWAKCEALYFDYPGERPPMSLIGEYMVKMKFNQGKIGFDQREYRAGGTVNTQGEPLIAKSLEPAELVWAGDIISSMRVIRDEEERSILRECTRWGNLAMKILQENTVAGVPEAEISQKSEYEASRAMLKAMPPDWEPYAYGAGPAHVFMKAGPRAILSHRNPSNRPLKRGDVIYANASGNIYGYSDELERNIFVGEPDEKKKRFHETAMRAQDAAFKTFKPGVRCSEVHRAAMAIFKEAGYMDYVLHHTGHARGLQRHEPPFLDDGDQTVIKAWMEFSAEPKLLVPDVGHLGHSDTVLVTEDGCEVVTYYPRDIESLTVK